MTELTLKSATPPSLINKDLLIGGLIGTMVTPLIGTAIGAAIGGYFGKTRLEREAQDGKKVSDNPSFWNKDALLGGLTGSFVGGLAGMMAFSAIAGVGLTAAIDMGAVASLAAVGTATLGVALLAGLGLQVAGIALGTYIGGKAGQNRERNEFEQAKTQVMSQDISKSSAHAAELALNKAISNSKGMGVDHVQELEQQRMRLVLQQQEAGR